MTRYISQSWKFIAGSLLAVLLTSCGTPLQEKGVVEEGGRKTAAPAEASAADGYSITETDLEGNVVARLLGAEVTVPQVIQKIKQFRRSFQASHEDADTVRMAALVSLLDEILVQQKLESGDLGLKGDPRVERMRIIQRQLYLARHYRRDVILPSITITPEEVERFVPRSRMQIRTRVLVLGSTPEETIRAEAAAGTPFTELVAKYSRFGSGYGLQGDLGLQIKNGRGYFTDEEEDYLWELPIGEISRPIPTEIGPMLVVVEEHVPVAEHRWEGQRAKIRKGLLQQRMGVYIDAVLKRHEIVVDPAAVRRIAARNAAEDRYTDAVVGSVDGQEIWFYDLDRLKTFSYIDTVVGATADEIYNNAIVDLENLSRLIALANEAESIGTAVSEKEEGHVDDAMKSILLKVSMQDIFRDVAVPADAEVEAFYRENEDRYAAYDTVRLRVILVDDLATAHEVRDEFYEGTDFSALALRYSLEKQTRLKGGDMGWMPVSNLPPDVALSLGETEAGELLPLSENAGRYSIVLLEEKGRREKVELDDKIIPGIRRRLLREKREAAIQDFLLDLRGNMAVELDREALKSIIIRRKKPGGAHHGSLAPGLPYEKGWS